ncbi:MAG: lytic transglycosylase F [Alphaproteobacteria bacterium]|nr:lytic transglycosylase F [Alphaproteobacteria bacterium]
MMMLRLLLLLILAIVPAHAQDGRKPVALPTASVALGDLDAMLARRRIRLIVPLSKTQFFIDRGREMGVAAEFGREFETWLNARYNKKRLPITVVFLPTPQERLLQALAEGKGDAVSANLTITDERRQIVDFAQPWLTGVNEILVTGPGAAAVAGIGDLAGKELHVRASSSYFAHLAAINRDFAVRGLAPIKVVAISERLQDEDILQMVSAGLLPWAVVDDHLAGIWARILPGLTLRPEIVINRQGDIAWAIRQKSPLLAAELAAFFAAHNAKTNFGASIRQRYFVNTAAVRNATGERERARFAGLIESFRAHGGKVGFDYLMLAAQGFQESALDQSIRSPRGAVGVMQLLPSTAAEPPVSIRDVATSADRNIQAGAIYMAHLRRAYVNDPGLDETERTLLTFAAYNAGPGNLRRFRREAARLGLDPDRWFDNVEIAAARIVGQETVQYVGNIYKYYVAYSLAEQRAAERTP